MLYTPLKVICKLLPWELTDLSSASFMLHVPCTTTPLSFLNMEAP